MTDGGQREEEDAPTADRRGWQARALRPRRPEAPTTASPAATTGQAQSSSWATNMTSSEPVAGPAGLFYAEVPNRIVAHIVDVITLACLGLLVAVVVGGPFGPIVNSDPLSADYQSLNLLAFLLVTLTLFAFSAVYFAWPWSTRRQTLGMALLNLQIGDERDAHTIGLNQAATRWLVLGIPSVLLTSAVWVANDVGRILTLAGAAWLVALLYSLGQNAAKQGFHDRYAHTIVIKPSRRAR